MRLLVVEDSSTLRTYLADGLHAAGYSVDAVSNGRDGLAHARSADYDAIVLDLMLPELDGLCLLRRFRGARGSTPVLIISARDRIDQRIEGLRSGADDYLVKPFDFGELLARIESLCRRSRGIAANTLRVGDVELDLAGKQFTARGRRLGLAPREYAVLEYLCLNAGRVVSRAEVEEHIYDTNHQVWSNSVDCAVAGIRRKLADAGARPIVQTRRGRGYVASPPAEEGQ